MDKDQLAALVARALPLARKIQQTVGDDHREHLPVDDPETMLKVAAITAVSIHANFASHELTDLAKKAAWKRDVEEIAEALVERLADQVSIQKN